ncbi:hypothetical protein TNCV_170401 [Trichonephila clavipes]|nr:hypothetical protein TNCV_170401 [Trichonephila clavipes]
MDNLGSFDVMVAELVAGVSRVPVLVPLKTHRVEELMYVKSVEARSPPVSMVVWRDGAISVGWAASIRLNGPAARNMKKLPSSLTLIPRASDERQIEEGGTPEGLEYIYVKEVVDSETGFKVRLFNPIVIRLRQEQVVLAYPFRYLSAVNGKVSEIAIHAENTKDYTGCDDTSSVNPTCGKKSERGKHVPFSEGESSNAPMIYSVSQLRGQELSPNAEEFHSSQENTVAFLSCTSRSKTVILPTAVVWVLNHSTGSCIQACTVLDSGSMSNIVTLDFANCLSDQLRILKCKSKHSYSLCGFRHNTLLHRQKGESSNAPMIYSASQLQGQELNPNAEEFHSSQENTVAFLSCTSRSKTVILPATVVWVLNHSTRIVFKHAQS